MEELLPCPFCGSKASFEWRPSHDGATWIVRCDRRFLPNADNILCGINGRTREGLTKPEAQKAWNTRYRGDDYKM